MITLEKTEYSTSLCINSNDSHPPVFERHIIVRLTELLEVFPPGLGLLLSSPEFEAIRVLEAMETILFFARDSSAICNSRTNLHDGMDGRLT